MTTRAEIRAAEATLAAMLDYASGMACGPEAEAISAQAEQVERARTRYSLSCYIRERANKAEALREQYEFDANEFYPSCYLLTEPEEETHKQTELREQIEALTERMLDRVPEIKAAFSCLPCGGKPAPTYLLARKRCPHCGGTGIDDKGRELIRMVG